MNHVTSPQEEIGKRHLFKDARGFLYVSSSGIPQNTTDTILGRHTFSPKEQRITQNFEIRSDSSDARQDDFFHETLPPMEDYMHFFVSEMLRILLSEGADSPKFERIPRRGHMIRNIQTEMRAWDPSKGKEIRGFTEIRVYSTKTRLAYVLRER